MDNEKNLDCLLKKLDDINKGTALYFYTFIGLVFYSAYLLFSTHTPAELG